MVKKEEDVAMLQCMQCMWQMTDLSDRRRDQTGLIMHHDIMRFFTMAERRNHER